MHVCRYPNRPQLCCTSKKPFDVTTNWSNVVASSIHQHHHQPPPLPHPPPRPIVTTETPTTMTTTVDRRLPTVALTDTTTIAPSRLSPPATARRLDSRTIAVAHHSTPPLIVQIAISRRPTLTIRGLRAFLGALCGASIGSIWTVFDWSMTTSTFAITV